MNTYDTIVIGGGPAGITAVLYMLRSGLSVAWVEKLAPGGQVLMTETIDNYPGFPDGIKGYALVDAMAAHLAPFTFDKYTDEARAMEQDGRMHRVRVGDDWIEGRTVIVCSGAAFRPLQLPREKELTGRGVSYCATCDGSFFRNQVVGVVGGGNTALEEALYLSRLVKKLYLVHRRDAFRGSKIYQDKVLANPKIETVLNHVVTEILGQDQVTGIRVSDVQTRAERVIELDGLFIFIGYNPSLDFLPASVERDKHGFILTDVEMQTNIPGMFAAGDVRSKLCRQVCTAVGDGATAANSAYLYLEQTHA